MRKVVPSRVLRNPRLSIRKMASGLKMSPKSLRTIVRRGLGLSSYKRKKAHHIFKLIMAKRLFRSKGLLKRFATFGLDQILFSDEKLFNVEGLSWSRSTVPDNYLSNEYKNHFQSWFGPVSLLRSYSASFCPIWGQNLCFDIPGACFRANSEGSLKYNV